MLKLGGWQAKVKLEKANAGGSALRRGADYRDARPRVSPPQKTSPAGAGPVPARNRLLLAAREPESGKAEIEQRERGGLGTSFR